MSEPADAADELGLDPVPRMLRLHEAILCADPLLLVPAPRHLGEPRPSRLSA